MSPRNKTNEIKFHSRFRPPTSEKILAALKTNKKFKNQKIFENLLKHFGPLHKPTNELDWLVQFNEKPESFDDFINECPIPKNRTLGEDMFIYYVQIGDFKQTKLNFNHLIEYSKVFFTEKTIKIYPIKIDIKIEKNNDKRKNPYQLKAVCGSLEHLLKFRHDSKSNKFQILAQSIHKILKEIKPIDSYALIGFTEYDLYAEESDLFVAGLCRGDMYVGVFSCFRYDPRIKYSEQDWFDCKIQKSKKISNDYYKSILIRSCKLLTHETCHLLGLSHCVYMNCSMNGSGHLEEDFRQSTFLCPIDLKKLYFIFDFDLVERYKNMKIFFDKYNVIDESKWIKNVLDDNSINF